MLMLLALLEKIAVIDNLYARESCLDYVWHEQSLLSKLIILTFLKPLQSEN